MIQSATRYLLLRSRAATAITAAVPRTLPCCNGSTSNNRHNYRLYSSSKPTENILSDAKAFLVGLTLRAEASHILVKGTDADAERKIRALQEEIGHDPDKFAEAAARQSDCPSGQRGGDLGSFGRYSMVPEFDKVVFTDEVGVVQGPIKTKFGYHLILTRQRTGDL